MTRFARAKGSKGSNIRVPESGTPWEVMKKQLETSQREVSEAGDRKKAEEQRVQNYDKFLKEEKKNSLKRSWCEFPGVAVDNPVKTKKKKIKHNKSADAPHLLEANNIPVQDKITEKISKVKKLKKKNKDIQKIKHTSVDTVVSNNKNNLLKTDTKNVENSRKSTEKVTKKEELSNGANQNISDNTESLDNKLRKIKEKKMLRKKMQKLKKQNLKPKLATEITVSADSSDKNNKSTEKKKLRKKLKKLKKKELEPKPLTENIETVSELKEKPNKPNKKSQPTRRKPVEKRSFKMCINGEEMELVMFDGFPVLADDAKRLQELQNAMRSKGIPKSEIFRTMKLERRRAEKHLTRIKKFVCFNCRKSGHLLSDCPEISNTGGGMPMTGICFKCGSTEHKSFECKVQKGDDYKFSKCFICKEQGHLARQCPDHPKGLYPKGGACKLCGDVTHFKKDCPTILDKKEDNKMTLDTLENSENLEDIEHKSEVKQKNKKKTKVISF